MKSKQESVKNVEATATKQESCYNDRMTQKPTKPRHNNNNKNKKQIKVKQIKSIVKKKQSSKMRNKSMTFKPEQTVMYLHEARKQHAMTTACSIIFNAVKQLTFTCKFTR